MKDGTKYNISAVQTGHNGQSIWSVVGVLFLNPTGDTLANIQLNTLPINCESPLRLHVFRDEKFKGTKDEGSEDIPF